MAEGTRLKDLNDHMITMEARMHKLTTEYHEKVGELSAQIKEVSEIEQRHYESMQAEAMRRHEELLKLLTAHNPQTVPVEKTHPA